MFFFSDNNLPHKPLILHSRTFLQHRICTQAKGLFTWREEDPSTRKILEGGTTFRLVYMQKFRPRCLPSGEGKEEKLSPFTS